MGKDLVGAVLPGILDHKNKVISDNVTLDNVTLDNVTLDNVELSNGMSRNVTENLATAEELADSAGGTVELKLLSQCSWKPSGRFIF